MVREGYLYRIRNDEVISKNAIIYSDKTYVYIKCKGCDGLTSIEQYRITSYEKYLDLKRNNHCIKDCLVYVPTGKKFINDKEKSKEKSYQRQLEHFLNELKELENKILLINNRIGYYQNKLTEKQDMLTQYLENKAKINEQIVFWCGKLSELEIKEYFN